MKKSVLFIGIILSLSAFLYAGGQAETGRNQASSEVGEGQLLPIGAVDPANYLQDFIFEKSYSPSAPITFDIDLLRDRVWEKGDDISVRIALMSNGEDYFKTVSGSFILYIQNPELFSDPVVKKYLESSLLRIPGLSFFFFDPLTAALIEAADANGLNSAINRLKRQRKQYANNVQLQGLLSAVESKFNGDRVHVLWITDENIIEKSTDASFFNFSMNVLSTGNTTFSYLGYGEVPNWITLNAGLMKHNGNSYFASNGEELCQKIEKDIAFFSKPAIEDITVEIVWSKYVSEQANFYPKEFYPEISGFFPTSNNSRPSVYHRIGGMNYSENKRFIHYVKIPALQTLLDTSEYREPKDESGFKIGTVYVRYFIPMYNKYFYEQKDMRITYSPAEDITADMDGSVFCDTIIQNTPLVIQEIANLVNRNVNRNYLAAIQLVQIQKNLLLKTSLIRKDDAVGEDVELLDKYYQILFEQAKTMNLLQ